MRWFLFMLALSGPAFAQSIVLTEAFSDRSGQVHFAVTKIVHREGIWRKNPLEVGTIIEPPSPRRAYPLRRFGDQVLFVLPRADNLRAYWSYNVHDGFVPALQGRTLGEVISMVLPTPKLEPAPTVPPTMVASVSRRRPAQVVEMGPEPVKDDNRATHELAVEALRAATKKAK